MFVQVQQYVEISKSTVQVKIMPECFFFVSVFFFFNETTQRLNHNFTPEIFKKDDLQIDIMIMTITLLQFYSY